MATPFHMVGCDVVLGAPTGWDAEKNGPCGGLPVQRGNGRCVSAWQFSWKEKLALLFGGKVILSVCSGDLTQPPVGLHVQRVRGVN